MGSLSRSLKPARRQFLHRHHHHMPAKGTRRPPKGVTTILPLRCLRLLGMLAIPPLQYHLLETCAEISRYVVTCPAPLRAPAWATAHRVVCGHQSRRPARSRSDQPTRKTLRPPLLRRAATPWLTDPSSMDRSRSLLHRVGNGPLPGAAPSFVVGATVLAIAAVLLRFP